MKKIVSLAIVALLITSALGMSCFAVGEFTAASGTCTVDAVKDNAYASAMIPANFEAVDGAATGEAYTAWDNDFLYVYVEVKDAAVTAADDVTSAWSNDCCEIYLNLSGEEGLTTDIYAGQWTYGPSFTAFAGMGMQRDNNVDDGKFAYAYTDTGYIIEIAIPWGADYKPAEGAKFPFCIGVNDDTDGDASTREFQTFTGANQSMAWQTADSNYDNLTLSGEKYVEPTPEPEPEPELPAEPEVEAVVEPAPVVETPAAQTADTIGVVALVGILAAAAFVLGKKR